MNDTIRKLIVDNHLPKAFVIYNYFIFLPVAIYPLFLLGLIFLFDHPSSVPVKDWFIAVAVLFYPLVLYWLFRFNITLYPKIKPISFVIPILTNVMFVFGIAQIGG